MEDGPQAVVHARGGVRGELVAVATFAVGLLALVALASLVAELLLVGAQSLVGLTGALLSPARCLALVIGSWVFSVLPLVAFVGLALLFSVATRNGITGVLGTGLVALATQLIGLIGRGVWVQLLLASAFDGWHTMLTTPAHYGPLEAVACAVRCRGGRAVSPSCEPGSESGTTRACWDRRRDIWATIGPERQDWRKALPRRRWPPEAAQSTFL